MSNTYRIKLPQSKEEYIALVNTCIQACLDYYQGQPTLSDLEYDQKYEAIQLTEQAHPDWLVSFSPTQRIIANIDKDKAVKHLLFMGSLDYKRAWEEVQNWLIRLGLDPFTPNLLWIEPKLDGISLEAIYNHGYLQSLSTRGTGDQGNDITRNHLAIGNLPLQIKHTDLLPVYGEVVWPTVGKYIDLHTSEWSYDTARNAVAGILQRDRIPPVFYNQFQFITYKSIPWHNQITTQQQLVAGLDQLGFTTCQPTTLGNLDTAKQFFEYAETHRNSGYYNNEFQCEIDGIVMKLNDLDLQQQITEQTNSETRRAPRWAVSWKFKPQNSTSTLKEIQWQVGRIGQICPVAIVEPVNIGGTTIRRISLANPGIITNKNLHIGDTVEVARVNDVIPYIVQAIPNDDNELIKEDIVFPDKCPECKQPLSWKKNMLFCTNKQCPAKIRRQIDWFFGKKAVYLKGLSEKTIQQLIAKTGVKNPIDILELPLHAWQYALGDRIGNKLYKALEALLLNSRSLLFPKILVGLGIPGISEKAAQSVIESGYPSIVLFRAGMRDEGLKRLPNKKQAQALVDWFKSDEHMNFLNRLQALGIC